MGRALREWWWIGPALFVGLLLVSLAGALGVPWLVAVVVVGLLGLVVEVAVGQARRRRRSR